MHMSLADEGSDREGDDHEGDGRGGEFDIVTEAVIIRCQEHGKHTRRGSHTIHPNDLKKVDDRFFVRACYRVSTVRHILAKGCEHADGDGAWDVVRKIDVLEQINKTKNEKWKELAQVQSQPPVGMDETKKKCPRYRGRAVVGNILQMPEYATIQCPDICGVTGIRMTVLMTRPSGTGSGVYIELTSDNLRYLSAASAAQFSSGTAVCKKKKSKKRKKTDEGEPQDGTQADTVESLAAGDTGTTNKQEENTPESDETPAMGTDSFNSSSPASSRSSPSTSLGGSSSNQSQNVLQMLMRGS
jgi:hypothetical protein